MKYLQNFIGILFSGLLLSSVPSCREESRVEQRVLSRISIEVLDVQQNKYYKTVVLIHLSIKNLTGSNIYFFKPSLWVVDKESNRAEAKSVYYYNGIVDYLRADSIVKPADYEDDSARIRLGKELAKESMAKKRAIMDPFSLEKIVFLEDNQEVLVSYVVCGFLDRKPSRYLIFSDNISERERPDDYKIYEGVLQKFKGYSFWRGDIRKDSLELTIRRKNN